MGYLDDIIIFSRSEEEHLDHIEQVFKRLEEAGLKLSLEKCSFFKKHIQYLRHLLSEEGIQPLPEKLESIAKMPRLKNQKEVKQFLGLIGYYRKFVPRFADISRVLNKLTRKDEEFKWIPECDKCFSMLKDLLAGSTNTQVPRPRSKVCVIHRCFQIRLRRCTDTDSGWDRSSDRICKWSFQRITAQLGSTDKGSVCNLHVSKEIKFLPRFNKDHSEKRPSSTKEILGEKHHECKGKQLGSRT